MRYVGALAISAAIVVSGCSFLSGGAAGSSSVQNWMKDGSLALSRPVPPSSSLDSSLVDNDPLLGFMPTQREPEAIQGKSLRINRAQRKIEVIDSGKISVVATGDGIQSLKAGTYTIVHKQETPLWYAPNAYFEARDLDVPTNNETERFRRGALGTAAVFLDQDTPIHNGPLWRSEIGGVRVDDDSMSQLFASLSVGDAVEIY